MPRPRAPLTFGSGLDRSTGIAVRDPRSLFDARNVIAREAGVSLRAGLTGTGLTALDWGTDVLATVSVERTLDVLQVVFDRATRDLRIYRVNPVTSPTRQLVGTWGTLNASAAFPIITHAEAGGVVYFAHAEEVMSWRLPTRYWTPGAADTDAGTLTTASADFDGSGAPGDIFFYGVCAYREYIAGWGWGTETDNTTRDRPEIVRLTRPDDPTRWPAESYFLCGTRSTRVIGCTPMPSGLLVGTRTQRYTIFGTDPETFGVELTDPSHGIVSPRAWHVINGVAYTWSQTGPRVTENPMAPSQDLAIPLDLMQAQPAGWPPRGPAREAFTGFDPEQRVLYWAWPNLTDSSTRTLTYALSLRQPSSPRFTTAILERRVASAGRFLTGKAAPPAASGFASGLSFTDTGWQTASNGRTLTLTWNNNATIGNETIEVWLRVGSGAWALHSSIATTTGAQSLQFTGRESLELYNVALRHRSLEGTYTVGYTGATPDAWTAGTAAGSKASVTTGAATPALVGTVGPTTFQRLSAVSAIVQFTGTGADSRCPMSLERRIGAGAWEEVASDFTGTTGAPFGLSVSANPFLAQTADFRLRHKRGALVGSYSNTVSFFGGLPDAAPTVQHVFDASDATGNTRGIEVYVRAPSGYAVEIEVIATSARTLFVDRISTAGYLVPSTLTGAGALQYRVRWAREQSGVFDYSVWTGTLSLTCNPAGAIPPSPVIDSTTLVFPGQYSQIFDDPGVYFSNPNVTFQPPLPGFRLSMPDDEGAFSFRRARNPSAFDQLLLFDHGVGVGYSAILFPANTNSLTGLFPQVAGTPTYGSLRTFLVDPVTKRRGPWVTVAVPT